jgi:hypothetical protein
MKKILLLFLFLSTTCLSFTQVTYAYSLDCYDVDGVSIFGFNGSEYEYLGSIANEFNSNSIGNEFGSYGSEFSSKSIFNDFSKFGSSYSSYSAFNEYTSRPPVLVDEDLNLVGYLTLNTYKSPSINPWVALLCAQDSFTSPLRGHEDLSFSDLSLLDNSSYNTSTDLLLKTYLEQLEEASSNSVCPDMVNGYLSVDGSCLCNIGYVWNDGLGKCTTQDLGFENATTLTCGVHSIPDGTKCKCEDGYTWKSLTSSDWDCVKKSEDKAVNPTINSSKSSSISNGGVTFFKDVSTNHKNIDAINYLYEGKIIKGYEDSTFKPFGEINRAELIKILVEGKGVQPKLSEYKNCFTDVKAQWFAPYVCYAKKQGWVSGYKNGSFKPAQPVIKTEALKMLLESQNIKVPSAVANAPYTDVSKSAWFAPYVFKAKSLGLLEENGDKYYPSSNMKRGGMSENLYRLLNQ